MPFLSAKHWNYFENLVYVNDKLGKVDTKQSLTTKKSGKTL